MNLCGVFTSYCSVRPCDKEKFGAVGAWDPAVDTCIAGAVANPPFRNDMVLEMIHAFNSNVTREAPYFGVALLPFTVSSAAWREFQARCLESLRTKSRDAAESFSVDIMFEPIVATSERRMALKSSTGFSCLG